MNVEVRGLRGFSRRFARLSGWGMGLTETKNVKVQVTTHGQFLRLRHLGFCDHRYRLCRSN